MGLCFGMKGAQDSGHSSLIEAERPGAATSSTPARLPAQPKVDADWQVGCKYKVLQPCTLWDSAKESSEKYGDLRPNDLLTIVEIQGQSSSSLRWAQVVPSQITIRAGWLLLTPKASQPVLGKERQSGSWEVPGCYHVCHVATLREGLSLHSTSVGEVRPGDEVLIVQVGLSLKEDNEPVRLRARVSTDRDEVGWLSLQNAQGALLLDCNNLLSANVAEVHKNSLDAESEGRWNPTIPTVKRSVTKGLVPWTVGSKYRTLESLRLQSSPGKNTADGPEMQVAAGTLVKFCEARTYPSEALGCCPYLRVDICEGQLKGHSGWLCSAAQDGRDLVDTRDQLEPQRVLERIQQIELASAIRASEAEKDRLPRKEANVQAVNVLQLPSAFQPNGPDLTLRELNGAEDRPTEENLPELPDTAYGCNDRDFSCGVCMCRVLPSGQLHPAAQTMPFVPAPSIAKVRYNTPPPDDLERWVRGVYTRFNPSRLQHLDQLLSTYKGKEVELLESIVQKYRVKVPSSWLASGPDPTDE